MNEAAIERVVRARKKYIMKVPGRILVRPKPMPAETPTTTSVAPKRMSASLMPPLVSRPL